MKKKLGFTLAEVLITLGIIGVVAAMTIPTLIVQVDQSEYKVRFKKAISTLNQAIMMNIAVDGIDFSSLSAGTGSGTIYSMFNSRVSIISTTTGTFTLGSATLSNANYTLFFKDGLMISFPSVAASCTASGNTACKMLIDVNGYDKPNKTSLATTTGNTSIFDQFTLEFYNQTVTPYTARAKWVLYQ